MRVSPLLCKRNPHKGGLSFVVTGSGATNGTAVSAVVNELTGDVVLDIVKRKHPSKDILFVHATLPDHFDIVDDNGGVATVTVTVGTNQPVDIPIGFGNPPTP